MSRGSLPTAGGSDASIAFGQRVLSLLETGSFTASYKYAVLLALLDAVLEATDEHGRAPTVLHGRDIGRRVLELYWPQATPFTGTGPLAQSPFARNPSRRDIVGKIDDFRRAHRIPEHAVMARVRHANPGAFAALERDVVATVVRNPIPRLQTMGNAHPAEEQRFIFKYGWDSEIREPRVSSEDFDDRMHLVGVAGDHLASLAGLLRPVIQREWLQFVAKRNSADVEELRLQRYLFGADRIGLGALVEPLRALQHGRCFYCDGEPSGRWEVDHFLPWSRLADDKLDNLVLAHRRCNNDKRAALAAVGHLSRWLRRFDPTGPASRGLDAIASDLAWPRRPDATLGAARALYLHQPDGTPLWVAARGHVEPLDRDRVQAAMRADVGLATDYFYRRATIRGSTGRERQSVRPSGLQLSVVVASTRWTVLAIVSRWSGSWTWMNWSSVEGSGVMRSGSSSSSQVSVSSALSTRMRPTPFASAASMTAPSRPSVQPNGA